MQGFVEAIHLFKTRPDIVVLQRYLKIEDRKAVEELHAFRDHLSLASRKCGTSL